jgi:hypothetical protein
MGNRMAMATRGALLAWLVVQSSTRKVSRMRMMASSSLQAAAKKRLRWDEMTVAPTLTPPSYQSLIQYGTGTPAERLGSWSVGIVKEVAELIYERQNNTKIDIPVQAALNKMKKDMEFLDDVASRTPQMTTAELLVLSMTVIVSGLSPTFLSLKVVEVLVPSLAALSASVAISSEYVGKVAVANGKEFSALAIQAAAEAEALLAAAERTKAVLPLCVGIATTASAFALLAPSLVSEISVKFGMEVVNEVYLVCPLVAVLAAAIAGLATQEAQGLASRAIGVGNRRFSTSKSVGATWLSATEQVEVNSRRLTKKWSSFALGVAPAPLVASLFPGNFMLKTIICAAIAAAQAAYYLAIAEYSIAASVDAVALKARASAVSDTYANQGTRAGAILPFTSALAGLCAAASAAVVELLPLVPNTELQAVMAILFPSGAALFASAAAVSKARCEVDSKAAGAAAAMGLSGEDRDGALYKDPNVVVRELLRSTIKTTGERLRMRAKRLLFFVKRQVGWTRVLLWWKNTFGRGRKATAAAAAAVAAAPAAAPAVVDAGPVALAAPAAPVPAAAT